MICNFYIWKNWFYDGLYILQQQQKEFLQLFQKILLVITRQVQWKKQKKPQKNPAIIPFFAY